MLEQEIVGQEQLLAQLRRTVKQEQVPHAQLFIDVDGYGGLAIALYQAVLLLYTPEELEQAAIQQKKTATLALHPDLYFMFPTINVSGGPPKSYTQELLPQWQQFIKEEPYGLHADWMETLQAGNKQGQIGVKEVSAMQEKMNLKSFKGRAKVCLVWGAEKMNPAAANKFLKILEEPPQQTYFLLVSAEADLLPTILSRCQKHSLPPVSQEALEKFLSTKEWGNDLKQELSRFRGSVAKIYERGRQTEPKPYEELLILLLRTSFAAKGNKKVVLDLMAWVELLTPLDKENQKGFLDYSLSVLRDAFLLNYKLKQLTSFQSQKGFDLSKLAPYIHHLNIKAIVELFEKAHYYIGRNASAKMVFTDLALQLTRLLHTPKETHLVQTKKLDE